MSSQIKPKVICKNLQDIIKESVFSTKRSSVQATQKQQCYQRMLKSEPRQRRSTERCNTSVSRGNKLYESGKRLNTSISKHSLESKEKIKILQPKISLNSSTIKFSEQKKNKHAVIPTSAINFYPSSVKQQNQPFFSAPTTTHFKSLYFNQVDAILTELEDFIRETREKLCLQMDFMNEQNVANMLTNQLTELTNIFKNQLSSLIGRSLYAELDNNQVLKPKNRENYVNQILKQTAKPYSSLKSPKPQSQFQDQLIKIEEFMQRQNTIKSTINSEPHQEIYIPTQTDAQILSMLVYKNKVSNTKRKIQSIDTYGQELMSPWIKSGRSTKDGDGEYSFRNKNSRQKQNNTTLRETDMKRKKNVHQIGDKSAHKENKEKSIYQIVLEENRKIKNDWKR